MSKCELYFKRSCSDISTKPTSKLPIVLFISQLFLYHLIDSLKFLSFWHASPRPRYESLSFSLSRNSLAISFFSFANSQCYTRMAHTQYIPSPMQRSYLNSKEGDQWNHFAAEDIYPHVMSPLQQPNVF